MMNVITQDLHIAVKLCLFSQAICAMDYFPEYVAVGVCDFGHVLLIMLFFSIEQDPQKSSFTGFISKKNQSVTVCTLMREKLLYNLYLTSLIEMPKSGLCEPNLESNFALKVEAVFF